MTDVADPEGTTMADLADVPASGAESSPGEPAAESDRSARRFRLLGLALAVFRLGPVLILVGLIVAMSFLSPVFFTTANAGNVLSQTAVIAILAIGQLFVIVTRGIDLSVGSNLALASVVGALAFQHGASGWLVILIMLASGATVGLVNGGFFVWGRMPHPFIITLATLSIAARARVAFVRGPATAGDALDRADDR